MATNRRTDRLDLTVQLTRNFLLIAADHIGLPDQFNDFYNPQLLPLSHTSNSGQGILVNGTVLAGQILEVSPVPDFVPTLDTEITITNVVGSTVPLVFFFENLPTMPPAPGVGITLNPGESRTVTLAELGFNGSNGLLIYNSGTSNADYQIEI